MNWFNDNWMLKRWFFNWWMNLRERKSNQQWWEYVDSANDLLFFCLRFFRLRFWIKQKMHRPQSIKEKTMIIEAIKINSQLKAISRSRRKKEKESQMTRQKYVAYSFQRAWLVHRNLHIDQDKSKHWEHYWVDFHWEVVVHSMLQSVRIRSIDYKDQYEDKVELLMNRMSNYSIDNPMFFPNNVQMKFQYPVIDRL